MKNFKFTHKLLVYPLIVALTSVCGLAAMQNEEQNEEPQTLFEAGEQALKVNNFQEAADKFELVVRDSSADDKLVANSLTHLQRCYRSLGTESEVDKILRLATEGHSESPLVLVEAAKVLHESSHYGTIAAGEFHRGNNRRMRVNGRQIICTEQDRLRALQWLTRALQLNEQAATPQPESTTGQWNLLLADLLALNRSGNFAWRLQETTTLDATPDYTNLDQQSSYTNMYAPVEPNGDPVQYSTPDSLQNAKSDGERYRWAIEQAKKTDSHRATAQLRWANFLASQFSVSTLSSQSWFFRPSDDEDVDERQSITKLHTLEDNETIAKLASGIKRFELPDEFNPIAIYRTVIEENAAGPQRHQAVRSLSSTYMNRRQYPKAAQTIEIDPAAYSNAAQLLASIRGPQLAFDPCQPKLAGEPFELSLLFRNATEVEYKAQRIDMESLLTDIKQYYRELQSNRRNPFGGSPNGQVPNLTYLGHHFRGKQLSALDYLTGPVQTWKQSLEPRPNHWDKRTAVDVPIRQAGAYLIEAHSTLQVNGQDLTHQSRILVQVQDSIVVRTQLKDAILYRVVDAESGKPLPQAQIEFFGFQWETNNQGQPRRTITRNFARACNAMGEVKVAHEERFQWLAIARAKQGHLSLLNFESFYPQRNFIPDYQVTKAFGVADRPAYRPGEKVRTKFWLAQATYGNESANRLSNQYFQIQVVDPRGKKLVEKQVQTDAQGGVEFEFDLGNTATLGRYSFSVMQPIIGHPSIPCSLSIRVEEYRKPEFEVNILAPRKPVGLGETFTARVQAKYLFGAPVSSGTAKIRVERSKYDDRFFPPRPYDWCYGPGYWWFNEAYNWYPGFRSWCGCVPGPGFGGWFPSEPPELVLEQEVALDATGEAAIDIDTATAKALFGDQHDHRYSITAEVRDDSRRVITGQGSVVASRTLFKIYTWLNQGFYSVGDDIEVNFQARVLDGEGVQTTGTLQVMELSYDKDLKPQERLLDEYEVKTDLEGNGNLKLQATQAGQYRIRLRLSAEDSGEVEGGYIFTVRGPGTSGEKLRFNALEITPDRMEYAPGDVAKIQIAANRDDALVALFVRPSAGVYPAPKYLQLQDKTTVVEIPISNGDRPNFFVEAYTVYEGELISQTKQIVVPPSNRVLDVAVKSDKKSYLPGEEAHVEVSLVDPQGNPVQASVILAAYDKALDQIAPDSLPPDIREFFWKWQRHHSSSLMSSDRYTSQAIHIENVSYFNTLGIFGRTLADDLDAIDGRQDIQVRSGLQRGQVIKGAYGDAGGIGGGAYGGLAMQTEGFAMSMPMADMAMSSSSRAAAAPVPGGATDQPAPAVRKDFADSAVWLASLTTDANGTAKADFKMPENLTGWKLSGWALGSGTRVGSTSETVVTKKPLLVRLQTPRFLIERDEVVCSTIVHNDTNRKQQVEVSLEVVGETMMALMSGVSSRRTVTIEPYAQARVDWRCKALAAGKVKLRTYAIGQDASDAMELVVPIEVYGALTTESWAGTIRNEQSSSEVTIKIPTDRRVDLSELNIRVSPSLAASMLDALPYLANYPYGCTEQTLNRFLPTVLTQRVLQKMDVDLQALAKQRNNLNAQELGNPQDRRRQWGDNPIYETGKVDEMVRQGVERLTNMQNQDGGWGWFSGTESISSVHLTAQVLRGLQVAQANEVAMPPDVMQRGIAWLEAYQQRELEKLQNHDKSESPSKSHCDNMDALVMHVLVQSGKSNAAMQERLFADRQYLSVYGKCLFALATHALGAQAQTQMLIQNIEQFLVVDEENETALLTDASNWWYWYGSSIEANALYLKLLVATKPQDGNAPRVVKYLLNNRKHSNYWNSTRDTALVVEAFADFLLARNELDANMNVTVWLDDKQIGSVEFTKENLFLANNTITLAGSAIPSGSHQLTLKRSGKGNLYWNAYSTNFNQESEIPEAGLEVKIERRYYLLEPSDEELSLGGESGQIVKGTGAGFVRRELREEEALKSGQRVEVELLVESKNDYEYLLIEDMKPAGLEPIDTSSGYFYSSGVSIYRELRTQKVGLLIENLPRGQYSIRYQLRSEAPGAFTALPAKIEGMYAPELAGNSRDFDVNIVD